MVPLFLQAYWNLLRFDFYLRRGNFNALHSRVRGYPTRTRRRPPALQQLCRAMDMACIWYWKEALCLQRSAAMTCLLRRHGVPAQLVIGAQQIPFKAHAWVQVDGAVVNDKPYIPELYAALDRC